LGVEIQARQQIHRRGNVVLRHLAGRDQIGHRREDVSAVDAVLFRAEHEVVARRPPRCLLGDLHIGHAVLGKKALLLGDGERRGIDQRDVAEDRLGDFRAGGFCDMNAAEKARLHGGEERSRAGTGLEKGAPVDASPARGPPGLVRHVSSSHVWLVGAGQQKSRSPRR
jgi:hypothetical protein